MKTMTIEEILAANPDLDKEATLDLIQSVQQFKRLGISSSFESASPPVDEHSIPVNEKQKATFQRK